jgi:phosphatidylserine/phosphatidylglycerophosphate/cardiolipin synthase-like enzyme
MKNRQIIIFIILYFLVIFLLYSSDISIIRTQKDTGFILPVFCKEYDCSQTLRTLLYNSTANCAFYDLKEPLLIQTLSQEKNVKTLLYKDNIHQEVNFSIPVTSRGLMHHKFCVINSTYVYTGTWNPTHRGTYLNDNYMVLVSSQKLAQWYTDVWTHIYDRKKSPPSPLQIDLSGTKILALSCPQHSCEDKVIKTLAQAQEFVHVLAFSFTSTPVANQLITLHNNNVSIEVLYERTRISTHSTNKLLENAGVTVLYDNNPYTMHEKLFIIDNQTIIVGSYNPSQNANTRNDENILIITNPQLAQEFDKEFYRVKNT